MGRNILLQTRLLRTLRTSRNGTFTVSRGSPFQCLITLILKNFSQISDLSLQSFSLSLSCPLSLPALVKSPSPELLWALSGTRRLQLGHPKASSEAEQPQPLSISLQERCSLSFIISWPSGPTPAGPCP